MTTPIDRRDCPATRHGTWLDYSRHGCRCPDAREACRIYRKRLRHGRQPAGRLPTIGLVRRLRALQVGGHTKATIAAAGGPTTAVLENLTRDASRWVSRDTHTKVLRAWKTLWDQPGTSGHTRARALAKGWYPALAWDDIDDPAAKPTITAPGKTRYDHAKVTLAVAGDLPYEGLSHREGAEVIRLLNAAGRNDYEIAEQVHADPDTIGRRRIRLGLPHRFDPAGHLRKAAS